MAKTYSLTYLDSALRQLGIAARCFKYEISADKDCLHIVYLDYILQPQFISVFRTSRLCYRIYHQGKLTSQRTARKAAKYLGDLLTELISKSDYYKVMTVAELNANLTHGKKLDLYQRVAQDKKTRK